MSPHLVCPADDENEANFVVANIEAWWAAVARGEPAHWTAWAREHPFPSFAHQGQQGTRPRAKEEAK